MTKSNGIASLKQAAKLLNKHAPDGESLAYINPAEARILKAHGGSGIMTLSGVPSYLPEWMTNIWDSYIEPAAEWLGYKGDQGGGRLLKDVTSLGGAYVGYKEAEELSDFQKKQYEEAKAKEIMNQLRFAQQTDEGKQLLTPQNVPKDIEEVSRFTEATGIPTMKTAAHGGRIGYNRGRVVNPGGYNGELSVEELWTKMMLEDYELTAEEKERVTTFLKNKKAQGGRIGYQVGTHPLDGIAMQMFGMTFENLNPLQQIVVTQSQDKAGGSNFSLDEYPEKPFNNPPYKPTDQALEAVMAAQGGRIGYNLGGIDRPFQGIGALNQMAPGGRIGAQKGGIMPLLNMGGMEKDYRQDGGFVPIGRKEKADDVPARLSKNEFVFTADAVRAAGGGDIDQGAQRMYNVMKNLEAGGDISEQSQGKA